MKLNEVLSEQQLDEINYKKIMGLGALALAGAGNFNPTMPHIPKRLRVAEPQQQSQPQPQQQKPQQYSPTINSTKFGNNDSAEELAKKIRSKYKKVDPELAFKVAKLAKKYEKPIFPRADDLLSVIGIESAFNPKAVSKLKKDPALGLTQVRAKMWGHDPDVFINDIEKQIEASSSILSKYNNKLNNPADAIHAYNVGLAGFQKGENLNPDYVRKFQKEKQLYK